MTKTFKLALGIAALFLAGVQLAPAADYPTRPVRLVVGFAAGGPTDILARLIGQALSERLGQQFVIENKPGGGGNIATEAVIKADADGYTVLIAATSNAINASYYRTLPFNFMRDIAPVAGLARVPSVVEVNPALPAKTTAELIAYAKANPGKINFASGGTATTAHLAGELFKAMAGVDFVHVPYRGLAPALTDLISGQVQVMFGDVASSLQHIRSGAVRALAVTTAKRLDVLPDVPTVAETVPGYDASAWFGFGVPKDTPADVIAKLNGAINASLADEKVKARLDQLGASAIVMTPAAFKQFVADETDKWAKAVKAAGVSAN